MRPKTPETRNEPTPQDTPDRDKAERSEILAQGEIPDGFGHEWILDLCGQQKGTP